MKRVLQSKYITKLKVATTTEPDAQKIDEIAKNNGVEVHRGSIDNVLERIYQAAKTEMPDWVVRLTSDCPLIDPIEIDHVIQHAIHNDLDYASNTLDPSYPDGLDTEVFKFSALEKALKEAKLPSELEHVTPYIRKNSTFQGGSLFKSENVRNIKDHSSTRLTVDTIEDFMVIEKLVQLLGTEKPWIEYVNALEEHPEIRAINNIYMRNEGYEKSLIKDKTK